ncbi:MAG: helix-hairpin-helix domain-containing protein [Thermoanaerobaculia bacterium]
MHSKHKIVFVLLLTLLGLNAVSAAAEQAQGVVNINTAEVDELSLLPRVGAVVAQRIADFREQNGRFKALEELMLVKGIGEKTFGLMKPHITLQGENTLAEKVRLPQRKASGQ